MSIDIGSGLFPDAVFNARLFIGASVVPWLMKRHGVFRIPDISPGRGCRYAVWYDRVHQSQRGLAPVHAEALTGLVNVFLDRRFRDAEMNRDFLVGAEGCQTETLLLTRT